MNKPCPKCGALVRTRFYMLPMVCKGCGAELKPRMIQGRSKRPSIFWWVLAGTGMAGVVLYNNTRGLRAEVIHAALFFLSLGSIVMAHYNTEKSSEWVLAEDAEKRK